MINTTTSDFILLIFSCEKYKFKALTQKETWLKDFTLMPYFHVIGNPQLTNDYLFDNDLKILYVKTNDDYVSLPKKVIAAYNAVYKEYSFKYIFKTDDDQKLTNNQFFTIIQNLLLTTTNKIHYAGYIVNVDTPYISQYHTIHPELPEKLLVLPTRYCSGRFYALSELAVQQLLSKKEAIKKEYLEDYAIGYYLDPILKTNMFHINTFKYFKDFDDYNT